MTVRLSVAPSLGCRRGSPGSYVLTSRDFKASGRGSCIACDLCLRVSSKLVHTVRLSPVLFDDPKTVRILPNHFRPSTISHTQAVSLWVLLATVQGRKWVLLSGGQVSCP